MPKPGRLAGWVDEVAAHTEPKAVHWCDGSEAERERLTKAMLSDGSLIELDQAAYPGCYLHRSHPGDVARTEHSTFICTATPGEAGPTNNWMSPAEGRKKLRALFKGAMRGRVMYVVPYLLGPPGAAVTQAGIEITDSPYVVLSMRTMTRVGPAALEHVERGGAYVRGLHSTGDLSPERRFIMHFPEDAEIWSVGSGYGGNALLGKKCHALRIASHTARREGWLAEHMLIVGVESPDGEVTYLAAAFPSACGKTNLAMLSAPASLKGYKVWTVGDDIAWMRFGEDGRLYAVNPETGFFGVVPQTSMATNPNAMTTIRRNTLFVNVALKPDGLPWWEGQDGDPPEKAWNWKGEEWTPASAEKAAHPNARYTTPAGQCPSISPEWESPRGVPISGVIFGGRRARLAPLVYEASSWNHGVYLGAGMATETTAAQSGKVGVTRRDPMAMLPFCGYHMGDYFAHWLAQGERSGARLPRIFHVNWFRTDEDGKFIWPGFGENLRVLSWIVDRCRGAGAAKETPIGIVPAPGALNLEGLDVSEEAMATLFSVERDPWTAELAEQEAFFAKFGDRFPEALRREIAALKGRLNG